jgi:hypothetical protein
MATDQSFDEFIRANGALKALDRGFLKGTSLAGAGAFEYHPDYVSKREEDRNGEAPRFIDSTEKELSRFKDYRVKELGEDSDKKYYSVVSPTGQTRNTTLTKSKNNALESFMESGGPLMLMTGGMFGPLLAGATGLGAGAAAGLSTALTNAAITKTVGGNVGRSLLGSLAGFGVSAIPGFSSLGSVAQGAIKGGVSGLVASRGDAKNALLSALTGGVAPGLGQAGISNPMAQSLISSLLRRQLQRAIAPQAPQKGKP